MRGADCYCLRQDHGLIAVCLRVAQESREVLGRLRRMAGFESQNFDPLVCFTTIADLPVVHKRSVCVCVCVHHLRASMYRCACMHDRDGSMPVPDCVILRS